MVGKEGVEAGRKLLLGLTGELFMVGRKGVEAGRKL
jgi:hypothetical protein